MKTLARLLIVTLFALAWRPSTQAQPVSTFTNGNEGWTIVDLLWHTDPYDTIIGGPFTPIFTTPGGNPGGFISATDRPLEKVSYFQAPPTFLGDMSLYYGGKLMFDLWSPTAPVPFPQPDVVLVSSNLTTLLYEAGADPRGGVWTSYTVPLSESAGWTKQGGGVPTAAEFQSVLGALRALRIRGEYYDTVGASLDNVVILPLLTIEVSEVRVCWRSRINRMYQPQYSTALTPDTWANLGAPVAGNGTTNCITDAVVSPRRFYRVMPLP